MSTQQLVEQARKHIDDLRGIGTHPDRKALIFTLAALAAELERLERKPQWLPIESAPKDGTHVLIATDWAVGEARFLNDDDHEGWYWAQEHWTDAHVSGPEYPTHWMPLPAAPDIGEGEGK